MSTKSKERLELEAQANALGLKFPANIGDAKLEKRINDAQAHSTDTRVTGGGLPEAGNFPSDPDTAGPSDEGANGSAVAPAPNTNTPPVAAGEPAANEGPVNSATGPDSPEGGDTGITGPCVSIVGPKRGRWRAGRHFTAEATLIPLADLTEDEMAAIRLDPALTVTTLEGDE